MSPSATYPTSPKHLALPKLPLAGRHGVALLIALATGPAIWFGLAEASTQVRICLIVFLLAILGWTVLRLPATPVALAAGLALVAFGVAPDNVLYASLGNELVWLLVAAFSIAAVLRGSGVAERFALAAVARAGSVGQLFYVTASVIAATAFVIPSTSGRAALLLPVYLALADSIRDRRVNRALALLFPTVILLSACASMMGAGAHLIAVDFMLRFGAVDIDFLQWVILGAPFALLSALLATAIILHLFLSPRERTRRLKLPAPDRTPLTRAQRYILAVAGITVALWATQAWHGLGLAIVALAGALAATCSNLSGVTMKQAMKETDWNLLVFLAATLMLGEALVDTGAASYVAEKALAAASGLMVFTPTTIVLFAAVAAVLAHLVVTSRTARVMVLVPSIAVPLSALGVDPAALIFLVTVGSGFCQTLAVSAKPVTLYSALDCATYDERDLMRLSIFLMPFVVGLLALFSLFVWPLFGLSLAP